MTNLAIPQSVSNIHIRHIQSVCAIDMLSQGSMGAPLYSYTNQAGPTPDFEEWKGCHHVMVEADIHLKQLHTSILGIQKVFEPLLCCLNGIWVHPYTITPAKKLATYLGSQGRLRSGNEAGQTCRCL